MAKRQKRKRQKGRYRMWSKWALNTGHNPADLRNLGYKSRAKSFGPLPFTENQPRKEVLERIKYMRETYEGFQHITLADGARHKVVLHFSGDVIFLTRVDRQDNNKPYRSILYASVTQAKMYWGYGYKRIPWTPQLSE